MASTEARRECETEGCGRDAKLQCPTCIKLGVQGSFFCSQEEKHEGEGRNCVENDINTDPWPGYRYTGKLRPHYPLECFKGSWASHKLLHKKAKEEKHEGEGRNCVENDINTDPWPGYRYTGKLRPHYPLVRKQTARNSQKQPGTDGNKQKTDRNRKKQTETDRNRQETDRNRQKQTGNRQKQTETDRNNSAEAGARRHSETRLCRSSKR
ncbi:unnamed protein product [Menidia menidia]|uniref:(Atlantic silverside) hypothetical protein n=1 Tax=Menidia menidia TaxID=238744 RepID=A0A8S4BCT2_9TELE|nr:unnamed protein product [Menidia menidia]